MQTVGVKRTLLWNCRGAATVPDWEGIISGAGEPELLFLVETHVLPGGSLPVIAGYDVVVDVPRPERFVDGCLRGAGGIAVLVRADSRLGDHVSVWRRSENGSHVWLRVRLPGQQMGGELYVCLVYLPPRGSVFWSRGAEEADVLAEIEGEIAEAQLGGEVLLAGDFNARIGMERDWIDTSDIERFAGVGASDIECGSAGGCLRDRRSADETVDSRGRLLLQLLRGTGLCVLNGRTDGDLEGAFTSIHSFGSSVIDLFLASRGAAGAVERLEVLEVLRELSDHRPVLLSFRKVDGDAAETVRDGLTDTSAEKEKPGRITEEGKVAFVQLLKEQRFQEKLQWVAARETGVEEGAVVLQEVLLEAGMGAFGMLAQPGGESRKGDFPVNQWFDAECKEARRRLREALGREDSAVAEELRKKYRAVTRRKKRLFSKARTAQLVELARRQPAKFWGRFKKRARRIGVESKGDWYTYCKGLYTGGAFERRGSDRWRAEEFDKEGLTRKRKKAESLNGEFSEKEVGEALASMKKKKAADGCGFRAELLQAGAKQLVPTLTGLFNRIWMSGDFPGDWNEGVLVPIFKKGDAGECSNYRTVTIGPVLGKLYAIVVERRLAPWAEEQGLRARGQAGFRRDHRVADHLFTLRALTDRAHAGKHAFAAFVDFSKAFDTIPRDLLWRRMEEIGLHGTMLAALRAMYRDVRCRVLTPQGLTDSFESTWGVKQGCPLSPLLFSLYIDPFEEELVTADATAEIDGDFLGLAGVPVPCLMFADDLVLLSSTRAGLQSMLGALERFSRRTGLTVNREKTKVVVFGAHLKKAQEGDPFCIDGGAIATVASYRYLGVEVSCSGSWTPAVEALSAAGMRASHALRHRCREMHLYDPGVRAELFDSLVRPVLLHGAEVWGACAQLGLTSFGDQESDESERVQRTYFRGLLGVRASTAGIAVLGEFGRFPLLVDRVRAISLYFNRLVSLRGSGRLVSLAFEDSVSLWGEVEFMHIAAELPGAYRPSRHRGWVGDALSLFGSSYVRASPRCYPETDTRAIVAHFRRRYLTGPHRQGSVKAAYDRLRDGLDGYMCAPYIYTSYFTEAYRTLARFRTGSHDLAGTTGRWVSRDSTSSFEHRLCTLCHLGRVEDEDHLVFECSVYSALRVHAYPDLFVGASSLRLFLGHQNQQRIASFIRDCFRTRTYVRTLVS